MILGFETIVPIVPKGGVDTILRLKMSIVPIVSTGVLVRLASNSERAGKSVPFHKNGALSCSDTVIVPTYQYIYRYNAWYDDCKQRGERQKWKN